MPYYRRNRVAGGTYFFTVALSDRKSDLLVREIAALRTAVARTRLLHPFKIDAWVVLPEHMHAVWTLPEGDADFPLRWTLVKRTFSAAVPQGEDRSASRLAKGERGIWQRRFWEHTIRDADDFARHVDYVHFNPVKHGLVSRAADWPFSSFRRAVARGHYPAEWAKDEHALGEFGEVGQGV
jgi:putative transposase